MLEVCSPVGVIESLTRSWRTTENNVYLQKVDAFKKQLGSTYGAGGIREVSGVYVALWFIL